VRHATHRDSVKRAGVREKRRQHGHRVGGIAQGGEDLEQPRERRLVPEEQPGVISQGTDPLAASVAFGTRVCSLLGLDLGQFLALGGDVIFQSLGTPGSTFIASHNGSSLSWQVYVHAFRTVTPRWVALGRACWCSCCIVWRYSSHACRVRKTAIRCGPATAALVRVG